MVKASASKEWLRSDLMRGMPNMFTPAWVADRSLFNAAEAADAWKRIGWRSIEIVTKHHDGFMYYPSELRPDAPPDRDYFGEQVAECAERDIRVIAYYSVGHDSWAGNTHPDWLVRDINGHLPDTSLWASPSWLCLSSGYADFALGQLDEIARKYEISGFWHDICGLPVDPDYCLCDNCRRAYSTYAGPTNLDNMRGSEEHWQYKLHVHREFIRKTREILVTHDRDPVVIFNGAAAPYSKMYAEDFEGSDSESTECHDPIVLGNMGRIARNTGQPFELLSSTEIAWVHSVLKPDSLVELEAFAAIANGATYTAGITQTPQGWISPGSVERLTRINQLLEAQREFLVDTEPIYDVGVVSSWDNREMRRVSPRIWRWADFLRQGHFLFNILPGFRMLEAQRVVVIPAGLTISAADADRLHSYVDGGGCLLVETPTPRLHGDGPYLLEGLLGVQYEGLSPAQQHYLQPDLDILRRDGMTHDPLMIASPADRVTLQGAKQIGTLVHQFVPMDLAHIVWTQANVPERDPTGEPGITVNRVGKGTVAFVVGQLSARDHKDDTNPWPATLAQNLVDLLLAGRTLKLEAGPLVEVVANRKGSQVIVHLLNHAYGPSRAESLPYTNIHTRGEMDRTAPLTFWLDAARLGLTLNRASLASDGTPLELHSDGDLVEVTTPPLGVHTTVVME